MLCPHEISWFQKAHELSNQTAEARKIAEELKTEASQLVNDISETSATLEDYRRQAGIDKERAIDVIISCFGSCVEL